MTYTGDVSVGGPADTAELGGLTGIVAPLPPLLIGGDDHGWQAGRTPSRLKRRDFTPQPLHRRSHDIVPGDVDAGNQPLLGQ